MEKTAYSVLGVAEDATQKEIDAGWKAQLKKYHPDVNPQADPEIAKRINLTHDILSDPEKKAHHDYTLAQFRMRQQMRQGIYSGPRPGFTVQTGTGTTTSTQMGDYVFIINFG